MQTEHGVLYYHHYDDRYIKSNSNKDVKTNKMLVPEGVVMVKKKTTPEVKSELNQIISDAIKNLESKKISEEDLSSKVEEVIAAYKIGDNHTLICKVNKKLYVVEWISPLNLHIKTLYQAKVTDSALEKVLRKFISSYKFTNIS